MWNLLIAFFTIFIFFGLAKYFIKDLNFLPSYDVKSMREVFSFSIYSFVSHIFVLLRTQADRIILTSLAGPTSVGYLAVPQQLNSRASYAVISFGSVLFPRFSAMSDNEIKKVSLFLNSGWALLVLSVLIFVPMTVLSPSFLELWINKEFAEKISFLTQVISASFIISGVYNSYAHLFNGTGKPQYQTIVMVLIGIFSTLVNIILINKFGFKGLGYAYWVTPIIGLVALVFAWKFVLNQKTLSPLISIFYSPLLSAAFSSYIISKILEIIPIHHWSYFVMYALFTLLLISGIIIIIEYTILKNHSRLKIILSKWKNK
jgi:O-antigen/teichoic acid export membrane protein